MVADKEWWNSIFPEGRNGKVNYTAYSQNIAAPAGAAAEVSVTLPLPDDAKPYQLMRYLDANVGSTNYFPPILDPDLFVPQDNPSIGSNYTQFALLLAGLDYDRYSNTMDVSGVTYDSSTTIFTTPINGVSDLSGNYYIVGNKNLAAWLCYGLVPALPYTETGTAEEESRAYPFYEGAKADLLREGMAAMGMYFRYGVATEAGTTAPFVRIAYKPLKIVPIGFTTFKTATSKQTVAQSVSIKNYQSTGSNDIQMFAATDTYQVAAGETQEVRITINGTANPYRLKAMTPIDAIPAIPYLGTNSYYVVTGNDGLVIPAAEWTDYGGKITVAAGDNPNELVLTIIGANIPELGPFSISEGEYPALYIGANGGVTFKPEDVVIPTGAKVTTLNTPQTDPITIDNQFIVTRAQAYARGTWASHIYGGFNWTADFAFGEILFTDPTSSASYLYTRSIDQYIGAIFYREGVYWRIMSLSYDVGSETFSGSAEWHITLDDGDDVYEGYTVDVGTALINAAYDGAAPTCDEFIIAPLEALLESEV